MTTTSTDPKELLNQAFKKLRALGFVARQNFSCCNGCAGAEIAGDVAALSEGRRAHVAGAVFYTRQDTDCMYDRRGAFRGTWVTYGPVTCSKVGTFGLPAAEVGKAVAEALREVGLGVEWDGDPATRIWVGPPEPASARAPEFIDWTAVS